MKHAWEKGGVGARGGWGGGSYPDTADWRKDGSHGQVGSQGQSLSQN